MSDKSAIEWTDATWNPVTGCTKVSPGCAYCYIDRSPPFRINGRKFEQGATGLVFHPERLDQPRRWTQPRRIFVNSLSDLFHEDIPDEFIFQVFEAMDKAPQHTFQVLTKRPERMEYFVKGIQGKGWPLPNVWLGVTAENQRWADERIPLLLDTPAAVRFVSLEPLLGKIDITRYLTAEAATAEAFVRSDAWHRLLHWVIVGGESAGPEYRALYVEAKYNRGRDGGLARPGSGYSQNRHASFVCPDCSARYGPGSGAMSCKLCGGHGWTNIKPTALEAVRSLRDQCVASGTPFLFKQWGGPRPKSGGRLLDGRTWDEYPA